MTSIMDVAGGAFAAVAVVAATGGRAVGETRIRLEAAALAGVGAVVALLDVSGVFSIVALILGLSGMARFAEALVRARREHATRLFAALERESVARSRFLPRALLDRLGRSSLAEVALGDRMTEPMTVLFADIRESTALTESLSSEAAFELIADFFARSARAVRQHHGNIDKYLGDGYMALFPRCVEDALDAAQALQSAVASLNAERLGPPIEIGIGVHTGTVTFGTVGDARHLDATVVSDTVNTAKRVEEISKRLHEPIVATDVVLQAVRDPSRYVVRGLGSQRMRGKHEPLEVFAVAAPVAPHAPTVREALPAKPAG
jgi:class 3 adenylate cyclase